MMFREEWVKKIHGPRPMRCPERLNYVISTLGESLPGVPKCTPIGRRLPRLFHVRGKRCMGPAIEVWDR